MGFESKRATLDLGKLKPGLIYDADGVSLLGKYNDELSAHRAKRQWIEVLNSYFLLERDRDYEMFVESSLDDDYFVLNCCFCSACGRYAFWRLINHQAPEAEERLGCASQPTRVAAAARTDDNRAAWVFSTLGETVRENEESAGLINRIIKLFQ